MTNQSKAYRYALAAVFFWSTVATAFKIALEHVNYLHLLFYSSLASFLILFSLSLFKGKTGRLIKPGKGEIVNSAVMGFLNPYLYYLVLFRAYSELPAQEALTLNYTWAIMVVVLSIPLLKQKVKAASFISLLVSFSGVIIIATKGDVLSMQFDNPTGTLLAVGSSVIWALYWILNLKDKRDAVTKLTLNFAFGFVYILITILISGDFIIPNVAGILSVTYIGLFEMGITFVLWINAMKLSETTAKVSNLIYLSPFLSLILINLVLEEPILISTLLGLFLILAGIYLQKRYG